MLTTQSIARRVIGAIGASGIGLAAASACGSSRGTDGAGGTGGSDIAASSEASTSGSVGSGGAANGNGGGSTGSAGGAAVEPEPKGIFVAVGDDGRRIRSIDDGLTWLDDQSLPPGGGDLTGLRTVVAGGGHIVGLGWRAIVSTDGMVWEDKGLLAINQWISNAVWANNQFVALGGDGLRATSTDGFTWVGSKLGSDSTPTHSQDSLAFDEKSGRLVADNDNGKRSYSDDGLHWTWSTGAETVLTNHIARGNGVYVALSGMAVVTSSDGATWTAGPMLPRAPGGIVFAQGHFTAPSDQMVFTSDDGITWTEHMDANVLARGLTYGHGTYVSSHGDGLFRSSDGLVWSKVFTAGKENLGWVTFAATP